MPTTLLEFQADAHATAMAAVTDAQAEVALASAALVAARAALAAAAAAQAAENAHGDAIRAALAKAPNPADAAALSVDLFNHVAAARAANREVVLARIERNRAEASEARAQARAAAAGGTLARAEAALVAAAAQHTTWTAWQADAAGLAATLADSVTALRDGLFADARARVEAELPEALRDAARDRQSDELDRLDGAAGLDGALRDAEDALAAHLATGGPNESAMALWLPFTRARAALAAAGPEALTALTEVEASLAAIIDAPPLSEDVAIDIASKTPAGVPTPAELNTLEAAVPDEAWRRLAALDAAERALDRLDALDPAAASAAFDAAQEALAQALDAAAEFTAERVALEAAVEVARTDVDATARERRTLLLSALRGDA